MDGGTSSASTAHLDAEMPNQIPRGRGIACLLMSGRSPKSMKKELVGMSSEELLQAIFRFENRRRHMFRAGIDD